jgi:HK97 gp10 family phage protein
MTVKFKVEGFKELNAALSELKKGTARNVVVRTLRRIAEPMRAEAQRLAPVDTGRLSQSIAVSPRIVNEVGNVAFAQAIKQGLDKKAAVSAMRKARRSESGGSAVQLYIGPSKGPKGQNPLRYASLVEFGTVKTRAQPYMRPAWDAGKTRALESAKQILAEEINKATTRAQRRAARAAAKAAAGK